MSLQPATIELVDTNVIGRPTKGSLSSNRVLALDAEPVAQHCGDSNVEHAAALFVTDRSRFQRYLGLMKNLVLGRFNFKKNVVNNETCEISLSIAKTATDRAKITAVAKALDKYGDHQLTVLHDTGQLDNMRDTDLRADEIRDQHAQQRFRANSRSMYKGKKEASHYAGLDVVCKINERLPPQHRIAADAMKKMFNRSDNFRMVLRSVNDPNNGLHGIVDQKILKALDGQEVSLNDKEKKRVIQIVKFCQKKKIQASMIGNGGEQFYAKFRETIQSIDSKLWDARQDRRELQGPAVSAHLKADGTPDRRYKENRAPLESELKPSDKQVDPTAVPLKKDGTPDRRYRVAKVEPVATEPSVNAPTQESVPVPTTHFKKDGTPDKRYAENRQKREPAVPATTMQVVPAAAAITTTTASTAGKAPVEPTTLPVTSSPSLFTSIATVPTPAPREMLTSGPRGGTYYINASGNKTYTQSAPTPTYSAPSYSSSSSAGGGGGREIFTGPRGGTCYINSSGNKSYCRR